MQTINELIEWGLSEYQEHDVYVGHGTESAEDELLFLCLCALGLDYSVDDSILTQPLYDKDINAIQELIRARVEHRLPAAYLVNKMFFCGLEFYVDDRVLVPRSPIAELIERQFAPWAPGNVSHVLDLCTGSGCIAIACSYAFPNAKVDASDLSKDALEVAKQNVALHEKNINLFESDVFDDIPLQQYDIVVSNPPYVSNQEMQTVPEEYKREPLIGLEADDNGLAIVEKILNDAKKYLKPDGVLIVEVGNSEEAVMERWPEKPFIWLEFERGGSGVFLLNYKDL